MPAPNPLPELYEVVRRIPPGRVVTYGDLASLFDIGARTAGRHMADNPHADLPWWRTVNASGRLPRALTAHALTQWRAEGTPLNRNGTGVAIRLAHADLPTLAEVLEETLGPLPGLQR